MGRASRTQGPRDIRIYGWPNLGKPPQPAPLTTGTSTFDSPSISPDDKWIAYVTDGHIYKMTMEGGTPLQLTSSNVTESSPGWSPDGKRIAFASNEGGAYKVWVIDADGANRRQFAKTQLSEDTPDLAWSPEPEASPFLSPDQEY